MINIALHATMYNYTLEQNGISTCSRCGWRFCIDNKIIRGICVMTFSINYKKVNQEVVVI